MRGSADACQGEKLDVGGCHGTVNVDKWGITLNYEQFARLRSSTVKCSTPSTPPPSPAKLCAAKKGAGARCTNAAVKNGFCNIPSHQRQFEAVQRSKAAAYVRGRSSSNPKARKAAGDDEDCHSSRASINVARRPQDTERDQGAAARPSDTSDSAAIQLSCKFSLTREEVLQDAEAIQVQEKSVHFKRMATTQPLGDWLRVWRFATRRNAAAQGCAYEGCNSAPDTAGLFFLNGVSQRFFFIAPCCSKPHSSQGSDHGWHRSKPKVEFLCIRSRCVYKRLE